MNIAKLSERMMGMDEETWARHSNPWSGWTRVTILPLLSIAVWSRVWLGWASLWLVLPILIWIWLNPRLFKPPKRPDAWMTKGVLGERIWLAQGEDPIPADHAKVCRILSIIAGIGLVPLTYGLWRLDLAWTLLGLVISMGAKLWFLDRMVWLFADMTVKSREPESRQI